MSEREPTQSLYVRIPEREVDELRQHAAHLDISLSMLVRVILHRELAKARRRNLIVVDFAEL